MQSSFIDGYLCAPRMPPTWGTAGRATRYCDKSDTAGGMVESTLMQPLEHCAEVEFWCEVYRGRPIAILYRHGRMHVYLDHVLQHNIVFESGTDALAWLIQRIDQGVPARVN